MNNKAGLACPVCGAATAVKDSRRVNAGTIRRRRLCLGKCGKRFTTYESTDNPLLPVNHRSMLAAMLTHLQEAATKVQVALRAMDGSVSLEPDDPPQRLSELTEGITVGADGSIEGGI